MLCPPKETHRFKHAAVVRDRGHDQVPAYGGVLRLEKLTKQRAKMDLNSMARQVHLQFGWRDWEYHNSPGLTNSSLTVKKQSALRNAWSKL